MRRLLAVAMVAASCSALVTPNNNPSPLHAALRIIRPIVKLTTAVRIFNPAEACPVGTYRSSSNRACTQCPPGKYNFFRDAGRCFYCNQHSYADKPSLSRCKACPEGKFTVPSRVFCTDSQLTPAPSPEEWQHCPAGHYNKVLETGSYCLSCPFGYIQPHSGSTQCLDCPAGMFNPDTSKNVCLACPEGKYQPETAATICFKCDAGTTADEKSSECSAVSDPPVENSLQESSETEETLASIPHNSETIECPTDTRIFQDFHGFKYCIASSKDCPAGMHSYQEPHPDNSVITRYHCAPCPSGKFSVGASTCIDCKSGQFSAVKSAKCASCLPGQVSTQGQPTCSLCTAGQFQAHSGGAVCGKCSLGRTSAEDGTECKGCAPGTFNPMTASACNACPSGKFAMNYGATACDGCFENMVSFDGDSECHHCGVGQYADGNKQCTACPSGYAQPNAGQGGCIRNKKEPVSESAPAPAPVPA